MFAATLIVVVFASSCRAGFGSDPGRNLEITRIVNSDPESLWTAQSSKFVDWHPEHVRRMFGVNPDRIKAKQVARLRLLRHKNESPSPDIPAEFDSRTHWPTCATIREIRDQGSCGSCWAIAAVEAMSDRICVASRGSVQTMLSVENLVACCGSCGFGCYGGLPEKAWTYYGTTGIVSGGNFESNQGCQPYSVQPCGHHSANSTRPACGQIVHTPQCSAACTNRFYNRKYEDDTFYANSSQPEIACFEQDIQRAIMTGGPVEAAFLVYEDFLNYKSGIYHHVTGPLGGGHAVKIIGWGVDAARNNTKYWLVANSWNIDWGEYGFFKILRGRDECGIESDVVYGFPDLARSPKRR